MGSVVRDIGYHTEVRIDGRGPVLVLVHGTPLELGAWNPLVAVLKGYGRVVRYDLRGHGTAADVPLPDSYDLLAGDLRRLLEALGVERAHVVGHSFGGQIGARFARSHSDRLASLTTICSRWTPFAPFAVAADRIDAGGFAEIADAVMHRWFTDATLQRDPDAVRYVRTAFRRANQTSFATALRMISTFEGAAEPRSFDTPVHIVAAEHDQVVTAPELRRAAGKLPRGSFSLVSGANHMLPVEHPEHLAALLDTKLLPLIRPGC